MYVVVAVILSVMLVGSGVAKLVRAAPVVENLGKVGVPDAWFPPLAAAEILGAVGLLAGIAVPALGILAAIGVIAYFAGAIVFHVRANDTQFAPPGAFVVLAVAALVLRIVTM
jgi:hypothetical protein